MNKQTEEAVALLKKLIATPSVSREEKAAADIIEEFLKAKGFAPRRHYNNVWALSKDFDESQPAILLNAHIDTVRPVSGWQHDPFCPTLEGDRLYGLGANDCGGGLVSLLQVFLEAPVQNLIYLASAEEEVSGKQGIESVLPLLPEVEVAIVGEPTEMQPAIAEKGLMVIDAVAHGKAGHAARNEGVNAIYIAMEDIGLIHNSQCIIHNENGGIHNSQFTIQNENPQSLPWREESGHSANESKTPGGVYTPLSTREGSGVSLFPLISPLLGPVKATVTIIEAGTQHNVVPDECRFTIDVRSTECYTNEQIYDILKSRLKSELKVRSFRLSSSHISTDHPLVQRCLALGMKPFGSPTLSDQALMRFPSLKLGPGNSARSHTADEYICLSEIEEAIASYSSLLSALQSGQKTPA